MTSTDRKPEPHPLVATLALSGMALVVVVVTRLAGILGVIDAKVRDWADGLGLEGEARGLPEWAWWLWTTGIVVASCWALLHVRGRWRRWVLALTCFFLNLAWLPVLALCGRHASVGPLLVGLLWGLAGAMIYAERHREPN